MRVYVCVLISQRMTLADRHHVYCVGRRNLPQSNWKTGDFLFVFFFPVEGQKEHIVRHGLNCDIVFLFFSFLVLPVHAVSVCADLINVAPASLFP